MSETRLRDLFAEAAEDLPVGPAPELAGFVRARSSRRRLAAASVGLAAAAVGVVAAVTTIGGSPGGAPAKSPVTPVQTTGSISLDCHNDLRSSSTWEGINGPYRRTPLALGRLFTNPVADEHAVVQSVAGPTAEVILLRGNGTAWARLDLQFDRSRGWTLSTTHSCPSRFVRMYFQHQPQF